MIQFCMGCSTKRHRASQGVTQQHPEPVEAQTIIDLPIVLFFKFSVSPHLQVNLHANYFSLYLFCCRILAEFKVNHYFCYYDAT